MSSKRKLKGLASKADRHILYQEAVQEVEAEIDFINDTYEEIRGRKAKLLREDFCGTANTACEWIGRDENNRAFGVDLDTRVLDWGREHNLSALSKESLQRIELIEGNVLTTETPAVDIVLAMNFSYYLFLTRKEMLAYFKKVHNSLRPDGIFFMDSYGGYDCPRELEEERDCGDFTYIWDQAKFDPLSSHMTCHIHFKFPDKSKMMNAFTYHWRLWTLPELKELLIEAGFSDCGIYWEGTDEDGEGDGEYVLATEGDADAGWIAYIVAQK